MGRKIHRRTYVREVSEDLSLFVSRGVSVPPEHQFRLQRRGDLGSTTIQMTPDEARELMSLLIKEFPLDAMGDV